jgi:hypothetical protein
MSMENTVDFYRLGANESSAEAPLNFLTRGFAGTYLRTEILELCGDLAGKMVCRTS